MSKLGSLRPTALMAVLVLWPSSGCTSSFALFDQDGLKEVKKVALIGFSGSVHDDGHEASRRMQGLVDQGFGPKLYKVTQAQLSKTYGWQFATLQKVEQGSFYKTKAGNGTAGADALPSDNELEIAIPHLMASTPARSVAAEAKSRDKLYKEFAVDSLLVADLQVSPNAAMAASLKGPKKAEAAEVMLYKCTVSLQLYTRGRDEAVWKKSGLSAETSLAPPHKVLGASFASPRQAAVVSAYVNALKTVGGDAG